MEHRSWQKSIPHPERDFPGFISRAGMELYQPAEGHGAIRLVGLFALTPDGSPLHPPLTTNEAPTEAPSPYEFLLESHAQWEAVPPEARGFDAANFQYERAEWPWASGTNMAPPTEGSMVLQSWTRDLPRGESHATTPARKPWMKGAWNSDFLWVENPGQLVPEQPELGRSYSLPTWWTKRLVRYHLIDNVAGLTPPFPADAIQRADMYLAVESVSDTQVVFRVSGQTRAVEQGRWRLSPPSEAVDTERGFETQILGRAVWDKAVEEFLEFNFVAIGTRWGGTAENRRWEPEFLPSHDDLAPAPIGVAFRLFSGEANNALPPFFAWSGRGDGYFDH